MPIPPLPRVSQLFSLSLLARDRMGNSARTARGVTLALLMTLLLSGSWLQESKQISPGTDAASFHEQGGMRGILGTSAAWAAEPPQSTDNQAARQAEIGRAHV